MRKNYFVLGALITAMIGVVFNNLDELKSYSPFSKNDDGIELVSVPDTDSYLSPDHPLSSAEMYEINKTAIESAFEQSPNYLATEELSEIESDAKVLQLRNKKINLTSFGNSSYTYLYCYATAWLNEHGQKLPLTATYLAPDPEENYYVGTWARNLFGYVKVDIQIPSIPSFTPTARHMVYYLTSDKVTDLKDKCLKSLTKEIKNDLEINYPGRSMSDVTIQAITLRGKNNSLANDHPLLPLAGSIGDNKIHTIVSLGDSLSDTDASSNLLYHIVPERNTWFAGHFSNGWVWSEYAADNLKVDSFNEAWAGAGVDTHPVVTIFDWLDSSLLGLYIPGLTKQSAIYTNYVTNLAPRNPNETLYTVLIGGNDFNSYHETSTKVLDKVSATIISLITQNNAKNIVVLNLPDISVAPTFAKAVASSKSTVKAQVLAYNAGLKDLVAELSGKYPNAKIMIFDTYSIFNQIISSPSEYNLINVTEPCIEYPSKSYSLFSRRRSNCTGYNYLFWDDLHPTTVIHEILGKKFAEFARQNYPF